MEVPWHCQGGRDSGGVVAEWPPAQLCDGWAKPPSPLSSRGAAPALAGRSRLPDRPGPWCLGPNAFLSQEQASAPSWVQRALGPGSPPRRARRAGRCGPGSLLQDSTQIRVHTGRPEWSVPECDPPWARDPTEGSTRAPGSSHWGGSGPFRAPRVLLRPQALRPLHPRCRVGPWAPLSLFTILGVWTPAFSLLAVCPSRARAERGPRAVQSPGNSKWRGAGPAGLQCDLLHPLNLDRGYSEAGRCELCPAPGPGSPGDPEV